MESTIVKKIRQLPPDLQEEALHFIDFLLTKKSPKQEKKPNLEWIGGLKAYRDRYTALELQKKAVDWRNELQLISFDKDFDQTERKRKEPIEVLK